MKRIYSVISLLFLGGMLLWANSPSVPFGLIKSNSEKSIQSITLLDNPTLNNNPLLKQVIEKSYSKSYDLLKDATLRNNFTVTYIDGENLNKDSNYNTIKAPASTFNVECEVKYDKNVFSPSNIYFYNQDVDLKFNFDYDPETWEPIPTINAELPDGEYTAFAVFWFAYDEDGNKAKEGSYALVFKENVQIPREGKLIFDASEVNTQIKFDAVLPDGQNSNLNVVDFKNQQIVKEGNVSSMGAKTFIVDKDFGPISSLFSAADCSMSDSEGIRDSDIWVNNLSDRFCAYRVIIMNTEDDMITACQYIGELTEGKAHTMNTAESYKKKTTNFQHTPLYNEVGLAKSGFYVEVTTPWSTRDHGGLSSRILTDNNYIYYFQDPNFNEETILPLVSVQPFDISFYVDVQYPWSDEIFQELVSYQISALPFALINDDIQYVNNNHSLCGNYSYQIPENGHVYEYPGQPRYTFWAQQQTGLIGNNAPINAVMHQISPLYEDPKRFTQYLNSAFIGRWGEVFNVDDLVTSYRINFNGKEVFNSQDEDANINQWGYEWGQVEDQQGEFDYYIENQNIAVDGIPGRNYTHIYSDWRKEDKNAPVIQMLMFRNGLDEITDRFDNAADGIVEFSGGDFNWHLLYEPESKWYFSCEPMDVKLEYSPYNQESWSEIEVMELPEYYFMPGFGYFYRGSIAGVDKMSENGWYDLKFTFTDLSGNYMEQTVSPAFKVASLTGKAEISISGVQVYANNGMLHVSADGVASVDVYSMDGRQVFCGIGNDIPMSHGAYIVKVNTTDGAESVHKVIL